MKFQDNDQKKYNYFYGTKITVTLKKIQIDGSWLLQVDSKNVYSRLELMNLHQISSLSDVSLGRGKGEALKHNQTIIKARCSYSQLWESCSLYSQPCPTK